MSKNVKAKATPILSQEATQALSSAPAIAPIATIEEAPKSYIMRLPSSTKNCAQTYKVPQGPLGVERWLAKKSYKVSQDAEGLYVTLTQSQADYYLRTLPADCAYMPKESASA